MRRSGRHGVGTVAADLIGRRVLVTGEARFRGHIVAAFRKRSGLLRLVVEDDRGLLMIVNPGQVHLL